MSLPEKYQKQISHAKGYLELEVFDEASKVLDEIDLLYQQDPEVLNLRMRILIGAHDWKGAVKLGKMICEKQSDDEIAFILTAQALYEMRRVEEAKAMLLSGPKSLKETALYHYNMGCYSAELGDTKEAFNYIRDAVEMDKVLLKVALNDPSLEALKKELKALK